MSPTTATTAAKWTTLLQEFRASEEQHVERAVDVLDDMVTETLPAFRLSRLDHIARARRVSLASIIRHVRGAAAPGDNVAELRAAMTKYPRRFADVLPGLHQLEQKVRELTGWRTSPPVDSEDGLLTAMSTDDIASTRILVQLGRAGFNPCSLLAIAFENVAKAEPDSFPGGIDLAHEGQDIEEALARVAQTKAALGADPRLLDRLLTRHRVTVSAGTDPADALLAVRAAGPQARLRP
jgi:hypothetical protein